MNRERLLNDEGNLLPEYDVKDLLRRGQRGKHAAEYARGTNMVLIDPDVFEVFGDADRVSQALRDLAGIIKRTRDAA